MTEPVPGSAADPGVPRAPQSATGPIPTETPARTGSWWERHRRQVWLWLAFLAAVTAPIWGGLILLWLFSPSSPFPKG